MSVKRLGEIAGKAALAGFAVAVLTAAAAPAKAAVVTWDLWIAYDLNTSGPRNWMTDHFVDSNPFGITTETAGVGQLTFESNGCGNFACGPLEDSSLEISFGFEGTSIQMETLDDFRWNGGSSYPIPSNPGPTVNFFPSATGIPFVTGLDFNAPFSTTGGANNWALDISSFSVALFNLANTDGHPLWTVLRGTLCHNGYGEPGEDSVCYRGSDDDPVPTPIPAALPLFASGLVAMGLGAWRRRRNG